MNTKNPNGVSITGSSADSSVCVSVVKKTGLILLPDPDRWRFDLIADTDERIELLPGQESSRHNLSISGRLFFPDSQMLSVEEVATRVGDALGIVFREDTDGILEELEGFVSDLFLCSQILLFRENEFGPDHLVDRIILEMGGGRDKHTDYKDVVVVINISEQIARYLTSRTGLLVLPR